MAPKLPTGHTLSQLFWRLLEEADLKNSPLYSKICSAWQESEQTQELAIGWHGLEAFGSGGVLPGNPG